MAKVQDTYNPVTGEYVKRISDYVELGGGFSWGMDLTGANFKRFAVSSALPNMAIAITGGYANAKSFKYDTKEISSIESPSKGEDLFGAKLPEWSSGNAYARVPNYESGFGGAFVPTSAEAKAYFNGWRMCNSDSTSPYYKSEVPYTPATWAEWSGFRETTKIADSTGITIVANGATFCGVKLVSQMKPSTKYGFLYNVISSTATTFMTGGDVSQPLANKALGRTIGNNKFTGTTLSSVTQGSELLIMMMNTEPSGNSIKFKDFRVFELPTGSQIEADFTNLSADELSAKYTFNGLCIKNWKKVTDGTGLTSTLPTASYEGYTPYRMIYQLATPEISYLTPKTALPLYDTNTIVETNTLADCKADVTVGYKLKSGVTAIGGDITAPTPDYMSAVNSVSEDGLKKGIVRGKNLFNNATLLNTRCKVYIPAGTTFTISIGSSVADYRIGIYDINDTRRIQTTLTGTSSGRLYKTFTLDYDVYGVANEWVTVNEIQVELSATPTAYESYRATQATLPTLRKIGTVADTYNPETGVLVQRIWKKVFDGTELSGISIGDGNSVVITKPIENLYYGNTYYSPFIGSHHMKMTGVPNADWNKSINYGKGCVSTTSALWLSVDNKKINTISEAQEWFAQQYANGTPVTVYYQLATPVVTTLTKTALPTYKPTTVIESDSTVKGNVSADYKLKANASPVAGDFIASPECVNDIKDLGNSIDVVSSVGRRNLILGSPNFILNGSDNLPNRNKSIIENDYVSTTFSSNGNIYNNGDIRFSKQKEKGKTYTLSFEVSTDAVYGMYFYPSESYVIANFIPNTNNTWQKINYTYTQAGSSTIGSSLFGFYNGIAGKTIKYKNLKLEEGSTATAWTPALEDFTEYNTITNGVYKTNILLGAPLRSVGAVKDRLFKDSDGKWKVERNIGEYVLTGFESGWIYHPSYSSNLKDIFEIASSFLIPKYIGRANSFLRISCSHFNEYLGVNPPINNMRLQSGDATINGTWLTIGANNLLAGGNVTKFKDWLKSEFNKGTPVTVQYEKNPTYETLSQELQTDLDNIPTFPEHNYVYTVVNDNLQPILHVDYKKLSWLRSRLLVNSLKIYSRNLTDAEMIQNYKVEKERFGM